MIRRKGVGTLKKQLWFCQMHAPPARRSPTPDYGLEKEELGTQAQAALERMKGMGLITDEGIEKHCPGLGS